jgi:hypothetical protein
LIRDDGEIGFSSISASSLWYSSTRSLGQMFQLVFVSDKKNYFTVIPRRVVGSPATYKFLQVEYYSSRESSIKKSFNVGNDVVDENTVDPASFEALLLPTNIGSWKVSVQLRSYPRASSKIYPTSPSFAA